MHGSDRRLVILVLAALLSPALSAQGQGSGRAPGAIDTTPTGAPIPQLGPNPADLLRGRLPPGFEGVNRGLPIFQGFPTFPPEVPGFGGFPGSTLPLPFAGLTAPSLPPRAARLPNAWPSWFAGDGTEDGFTAEVALLTQTAERVWFREVAAEPMVPLAFHDKFRVLRSGAELVVQHGGAFQLAFNDGSTVRSAGIAQARLPQVADEVIAIDWHDVTHAELVSVMRAMRIGFEPAGISVDMLQSRLEIESDGSLVTLANHGPGQLAVAAPFGRAEVPAGHRVRVLVASDRHEAIAGGLKTEGDLSTERDGRVLRAFAGAQGGAIEWVGARFRLTSGATLTLDPLAGTEFPTIARTQTDK